MQCNDKNRVSQESEGLSKNAETKSLFVRGATKWWKLGFGQFSTVVLYCALVKEFYARPRNFEMGFKRV